MTRFRPRASIDVARLVPLIATALLFAWLADLMISGRPSLTTSVFPATLQANLRIGIVAVIYMTYLGLRLRLPGPTRLDAVAAAFVLVYAVATYDSVYPRASAEAVLILGTAVLTFYAVHDFDFIDTELIVRGVVFAGAVCAVVGLVDVWHAYSHWLDLVRTVEGSVSGTDRLPPTVPQISGVGDHAAVLAMALNLTLPFAIALTLRPAPRFDRVFGALAAVLIVVAFFFTRIEAAWVATAIGLALFAALYVIRNHDFIAALSGPRGRWLIGGMVGVVLLTMFVAGLVAGSWESRPSWLLHSDIGEDAANVAIDITRDRPILGSGPFTYPLLYDTYGGAHPAENIDARNGYLNVLVDAGLLGAIVVAAGGMIVLLALASAYRHANPSRRILIAATAASLATIAAHGLTASPNGWQTALLPLAVVLAIAMRLAPRRRLVVPSRLPRFLVLALLPVMIGGWLIAGRSHEPYHASLRHFQQQDLPESAFKGFEARDSDPSNAAHQLHLGIVRATEHVRLAEQGFIPPDFLLNEATNAFFQTIRAEPRSALAYANDAIARDLQGDTVGAVAAAHQALDYAPDDPVIATVAGTVFESASRLEDARSAYALAMTLDPSLTQSPFWQTTAQRLQLRDDALARATLTPCELGREAAFFGRFPVDYGAFAFTCTDFVGSHPADVHARADLALILYAAERTDDARREAAEAVSRDPDDAYARTTLAIVGSQGDLALARHELMLASQLGDPIATLLLVYTYEPAFTNDITARLALPVERDTAPPELLRRLREELPDAAPVVVAGNKQHYRLGEMYYRIALQREAPPFLLIPSDWMDLASPRAIAILEALK